MTLTLHFSLTSPPGTAQFLHYHHRSDIHGSNDPADSPPEGELQREDACLCRLGRVRRRTDAPLVHRDGRRRKYHGQGKSHLTPSMYVRTPDV